MTCFMSCKTVIIERSYVPDITFPEFPNLGEYEKTKDGKIIISEDYIKKLYVFRTFYFDEKNKYEEKKKIYIGDMKNEF